jgi:hypothetical protein
LISNTTANQWVESGEFFLPSFNHDNVCIARSELQHLYEKRTIDLGAMNAQSKRETIETSAIVPSSKSEKNVEKEKRRAMNAVSEI